MTVIGIERSADDLGMFRAVKIRLDGRTVATVGSGARVELHVPSGPHELSARLDWTRSNVQTFDCSGQARICFTLRHRYQPWQWPYAATFGAAKGLILEPDDEAGGE